ncbi:hypothetical protein Pelo_7568 [Pelomyxa schiedti]|nr:hypothetical protein Pelo_7568 [Pelomyxa schiedti]
MSGDNSSTTAMSSTGVDLLGGLGAVVPTTSRETEPTVPVSQPFVDLISPAPSAEVSKPPAILDGTTESATETTKSEKLDDDAKGAEGFAAAQPSGNSASSLFDTSGDWFAPSTFSFNQSTPAAAPAADLFFGNTRPTTTAASTMFDISGAEPAKETQQQETLNKILSEANELRASAEESSREIARLREECHAARDAATRAADIAKVTLSKAESSAMELVSLRAKLATAEASGSVKCTQLKSELEQLRKASAIGDLVLRAIYSISTPRFLSQPSCPYFPHTSQVILDYVHSLESESSMPTFEGVIEALKIVSKTQSSNPEMSVYWIVSMWYILNALLKETPDPPMKPSDYLQEPSPSNPIPTTTNGSSAGSSGAGSRANSTSSGTGANSAISSPPSPSLCKNDSGMNWFLIQLNKAISDAFTLIMKRVQQLLKPMLVPAFLEQQAPQPGPATPKKSTGQPPQRVHHPSEVIEVMVDTLKQLDAGHMPQNLCNQFFSQLCHWINAILFNKLVCFPHLCTCGNGIQVKLGLSMIEDFLSKTSYLSTAKEYLEHTRQACNLFFMDKSILLDQGSLTSIFGCLNVCQITLLVQSFKPDMFSPVPVDPKILVALKKYQDQSLPLMLDPDLFIIPHPTPPPSAPTPSPSAPSTSSTTNPPNSTTPNTATTSTD